MNRFPDARRTFLGIVTALALVLWAGCETPLTTNLTSAGGTSLAADGEVAPSQNPANHEKKETPLEISRGQEVTLEDYLVPRKTTIFEFTSHFDARCRAMSKRLDKLHSKKEDIAVVRIDINRPEIKGVDWSSPVCQQYQVHSLPVFKIYDAAGKLIAEDIKATNLVERWASR